MQLSSAKGPYEKPICTAISFNGRSVGAGCWVEEQQLASKLAGCFTACIHIASESQSAITDTICCTERLLGVDKLSTCIGEGLRGKWGRGNIYSVQTLEG